MLIACTECHLQYDVSGLSPGDPLRCKCGELNRVAEHTPHEARTVHCSACGGRLQSGSSSCGYCGNEITLADRNLGVACPECFARLPDGAKFCLECGVPIRAERVQAMRVDAACPRCAGSMARCDFDGGHYTECTSCGGLWLEEEFFEHMIVTRDTVALGRITPGKPDDEDGGSAASSVRNDVRYLKCPVCTQLMHRKNFGKVSGVIIDWCKGCGFWFDTEELERIVRFVQGGGMDRTRKRELAEHEARVRSLERRQRRPAEWQRSAPPARGIDMSPEIGGSFQELSGYTVFEALREFVGDLVGKIRSR